MVVVILWRSVTRCLVLSYIPPELPSLNESLNFVFERQALIGSVAMVLMESVVFTFVVLTLTPFYVFQRVEDLPIFYLSE